MADSKRILIPWSGGADSTLLIAEALRAKDRIWYCTFEAGQPNTQIMAEAVAREKLEERLKRRFAEAPEMHLHRSKLVLDTSGTNLPMKQLPAWFMHLITMVADKSGQFYFDEIHLGYLLNDDAAYSLSNLKLAWHHMCLAVYGIDRDPPKLMFPLLRYRKGQVLAELTQLGLIDLISICELPQLYDDGWRQCNECPSCHKHNTAKAVDDLHNGMRWRGDLLVDYDHRTKPNPELVDESQLTEYPLEKEATCEQTS
jgi:7-cyano-7-deazaguanine synthase in queuosine biosynthesis